MSCRRPSPSWSNPPQHTWHLDEIKHGNIISTHSLNSVIQNHNSNDCIITFGRIDDPTLVDIVTAHESCSRLHARIAFDRSGTPWLRDLGSGNGSFVNEKRLPREACGKEIKEDVGVSNDSNNRKGSRGVVLYPGDAIRFGASTRIYILEGPEEFERGAVKLKRKMNEAAAAAARSEPAPGTAAEEEAPSEANADVCGWGMSDDVIPTEQDQKSQVNDNSNLPALPSIDSFFFSSKYKIPNPLHQLHSQYNTKTHKLQSIQTESSRIMQKENMGVELTEGQRGQLAKNKDRILSLEKDVANLKDRIEDGMHTAIHGKDRAKKRSKEEDRYDNDDDVDDFYDRTASSSKRQRSENNNAESEESLIEKWKSLLDGHARHQRVASHVLHRCTALQQQIDNSTEDDENAFFLQNDLSLANDNLSKATKTLEETGKELDEVEYLLNIVNPKLVWDRKEGLIGTNIVEKMEGAAASQSLDQNKNDIDDTGRDSIMMPPPPPSITASLSMPPPPPMNVASSSKQAPPEQRKISGPVMPPTTSDDGKSSEKSSVQLPNKLENATKPQKKKKLMGPMRPPANVQGTLAALKQAASQSTRATGSRSESSHPSGHSAPPPKNKAVISDPFESRKDVWNAPVDQDGSGRTALHDKFKGRY